MGLCFVVVCIVTLCMLLFLWFILEKLCWKRLLELDEADIKYPTRNGQHQGQGLDLRDSEKGMSCNVNGSALLFIGVGLVLVFFCLLFYCVFRDPGDNGCCDTHCSLL
jgi:hypothetical protein